MEIGSSGVIDAIVLAIGVGLLVFFWPFGRQERSEEERVQRESQAKEEDGLGHVLAVFDRPVSSPLMGEEQGGGEELEAPHPSPPPQGGEGSTGLGGFSNVGERADRLRDAA